MEKKNIEVQTPGEGIVPEDYSDDAAAQEPGAEVITEPVNEPRLIGDDWSSKTSHEAHAAGVKSTVLCSDGYYVPGA